MKKIVKSSQKVHRVITELGIRRKKLASSKAKLCMSNRENNVLIKGKKDAMSPFRLCVNKFIKKGAL